MNERGFTLLETLIYIALFSVLMTGALITVYELLLSSEYNRMHISIQEEGTFIQRKLNWAFKGATDVSLLNAHTIIITRPDLHSQSPLIIRFDDTTVYFKRGTHDEVVLTGKEFAVTDVVMSISPSLGNIPPQVRISYKVNDVPYVYYHHLTK